MDWARYAWIEEKKEEKKARKQGQKMKIVDSILDDFIEVQLVPWSRQKLHSSGWWVQ